LWVNLYELLGVAETASADEIKAAYRDQVKTAHPDKGGDAAAFAKIQGAWEVLRDDARRARYDQELAHNRDRLRRIRETQERARNGAGGSRSTPGSGDLYQDLIDLAVELSDLHTSLSSLEMLIDVETNPTTARVLEAQRTAVAARIDTLRAEMQRRVAGDDPLLDWGRPAPATPPGGATFGARPAAAPYRAVAVGGEPVRRFGPTRPSWREVTRVIDNRHRHDPYDRDSEVDDGVWTVGFVAGVALTAGGLLRDLPPAGWVFLVAVWWFFAVYLVGGYLFVSPTVVAVRARYAPWWRRGLYGGLAVGVVAAGDALFLFPLPGVGIVAAGMVSGVAWSWTACRVRLAWRNHRRDRPAKRAAKRSAGGRRSARRSKGSERMPAPLRRR
jgi:hypothetical protein